MIRTILSIIICIILFITLAYNGTTANDKVIFKFKPRCLLSLLVPLIAIGTLCYTFINANNVGIQYNPFNGGTSTKVLSEGFVIKSPFVKIYQLTTEVQTKQLVGLTSQTKDSQFVTNDIDVKYRVNELDAYQVFKNYRTMSNIDEKLIAPIVQRSVEAVTVQYNIIEILGASRNEVYTNIEKELENRFEGTGITIEGIVFVDTDGGAEIEQAIRDEAVAAKKVDQAEQEKLAAQVKAEKDVIEAEAKKKVAILEAEAEAEAIRIIQEQLAKDPTYIEYAKWQKWNGELPQVVSDSSSIVDLR